jgi:peptide/nickel transport system permease protein
VTAVQHVVRQDALIQATRALARRGTAQRRWARIALVTGASIVVIVLLLSLLQPLLGLPAPNKQDLDTVLTGPSLAHPLGTDDLGRDMLSRTLTAGRLDLAVAGLVTLLSVVIGVVLGAIAGFFGGFIDAVIMRVADVVLAFPFLVLLLAIVAIFGPGLTGVYVGVPLVGWALYARLTRAEMLVVREKEYVLAARTLGFSTWRTLIRHAAPNVWRPALIYSMADIVLNIMLLATLSYLGVGVQPPQAEWGGLIADGQEYLLQAWWISTLPGVVVVFVGIGFSLAGDAIADLLGEEVRLTA